MKRVFTLLLLSGLSLSAHADCVLQADTADAAFALGPFLDSTDGITAETGLTITEAEVFFKRKGSTTFVDKSDATSCTHRADGWYTCPLDATDTSVEGNLIVQVTETGAIPVWRECLVVGNSYYDLVDATTSLLTSRDTGLMLSTTVATVTSQTVLILTAGPSNDDALNDSIATLVGGTEECSRQVSDYNGGATTATLATACPFTVANADTIRFHTSIAGSAPSAAAIADAVMTESVDDHKATGASLAEHIDAIKTDSTGIITDTGTDGVVLANDSITAAKIAADAIGASEVATDAIGAAELASDASAEIWAIQCEDQGSTYTCREAISVLLAEAAGTAVYTSGTRTWVVKDPSGTETRLTLVYGAELDGDRSTSTPAPATY